jgi:hypothetical protein
MIQNAIKNPNNLSRSVKKGKHFIACLLVPLLHIPVQISNEVVFPSPNTDPPAQTRFETPPRSILKKRLRMRHDNGIILLSHGRQ